MAGQGQLAAGGGGRDLVEEVTPEDPASDVLFERGVATLEPGGFIPDGQAEPVVVQSVGDRSHALDAAVLAPGAGRLADFADREDDRFHGGLVQWGAGVEKTTERCQLTLGGQRVAAGADQLAGAAVGFQLATPGVGVVQGAKDLVGSVGLGHEVAVPA